MNRGMIKTEKEIELIGRGGRLLSRVLGKVAAHVAPGVTTAQLDDLAEKEILKAGGRPAFKGYRIYGVKMAYNSTVCTSVNDEVVHGLAHPGRVLKEGDIIGLDIGMQYPAKDGLYTDMAMTVPVGKVSESALKLIRVTRECLERAISVVHAGARISDIGSAVQTHAESNGYGVVRDLVGHGVGYDVHEDPRVPNYVDQDYPDTILKKGMVIAIEPMINAGTWRVKTLPDGWTVKTSDGSLSAHFENTIAVTEDGCEILTPFPVL
jgi:methionyl aminopeptidase